MISSAAKLGKQWKRCVLLAAVIILAIILVMGFYFLFREKPKAVIIDQLGQTYPNPGLIRSITEKFTRNGYRVDYIAPKEVTLDFYRSLPTKGYRYIILRAHLCTFRDDPIPSFRDELAISTNELYSNSKYVEEQKKGKLACLVINNPHDGNVKYFGISSRFIESSVEGNFNDATLILMGCDGLTFSKMANAFLQKGVDSIIGWDRPVSLKHTDSAVESLVTNILNRDMEVKEAVENVMAKMGEDPKYGSKLLVYQ